MLACPRCRYDTLNTNSLRLWSAMPDTEIDLSKFNEGEYGTALAALQRALEITQVTCATTAANYAHTYTCLHIFGLFGKEEVHLVFVPPGLSVR